mmetsp:Transcript_27602/g.85542  ORF Transcript_27602/g.85542 Transcript_27602/m.85542 type:complete len:887 (-) Transcript_27602:69-2729(-)
MLNDARLELGDREVLAGERGLRQLLQRLDLGLEHLVLRVAGGDLRPVECCELREQHLVFVVRVERGEALVLLPLLHQARDVALALARVLRGGVRRLDVELLKHDAHRLVLQLVEAQGRPLLRRARPLAADEQCQRVEEHRVVGPAGEDERHPQNPAREVVTVHLAVHRGREDEGVAREGDGPVRHLELAAQEPAPGEHEVHVHEEEADADGEQRVRGEVELGEAPEGHPAADVRGAAEEGTSGPQGHGRADAVVAPVPELEALAHRRRGEHDVVEQAHPEEPVRRLAERRRVRARRPRKDGAGEADDDGGACGQQVHRAELLGAGAVLHPRGHRQHEVDRHARDAGPEHRALQVEARLVAARRRLRVEQDGEDEVRERDEGERQALHRVVQVAQHLARREEHLRDVAEEQEAVQHRGDVAHRLVHGVGHVEAVGVRDAAKGGGEPGDGERAPEVLELDVAHAEVLADRVVRLWELVHRVERRAAQPARVRHHVHAHRLRDRVGRLADLLAPREQLRLVRHDVALLDGVVRGPARLAVRLVDRVDEHAEQVGVRLVHGVGHDAQLVHDAEDGAADAEVEEPLEERAPGEDADDDGAADLARRAAVLAPDVQRSGEAAEDDAAQRRELLRRPGAQLLLQQRGDRQRRGALERRRAAGDEADEEVEAHADDDPVRPRVLVVDDDDDGEREGDDGCALRHPPVHHGREHEQARRRRLCALAPLGDGGAHRREVEPPLQLAAVDGEARVVAPAQQLPVDEHERQRRVPGGLRRVGVERLVLRDIEVPRLDAEVLEERAHAAAEGAALHRENDDAGGDTVGDGVVRNGRNGRGRGAVDGVRRDAVEVRLRRGRFGLLRRSRGRHDDGGVRRTVVVWLGFPRRDRHSEKRGTK